MPSDEQWENLGGATGCFTGAVVDYRSPCSAKPGKPCQILRQVDAWNELLFPAKIQLREIPGTLGKLALVNVDCAGLYTGVPEDVLLQNVRYVHGSTSPRTTILVPDETEDDLRLVLNPRRFMGGVAISEKSRRVKLLVPLVKTAPFLAVLSLEGISLEEEATKNLMAGLTENGVLRDLTLGTWVIPETCRKELAQYLMLTPSLISFSYTSDSVKIEIAVIEAILCNKGISKLLEDLAELVNISVAEIGRVAHRHLQRTASLHDFMRITGVVKERVVCRARDDGRMQLEDLSDDCWALVRQYLTLDDVEEAIADPGNL
ncbi:hypothetical protein HPB52_008553 [Rhipicephalus sanguineus]|uniref:Uncharacterized protein n=1 Tax=Rhipicephalus sanguineus TaxID=34632 RepID=A0A9D4T1X6_RHISA|nr:hypothetical protein HPB52_008553 [Rhipicephalus sanguineus]